VLPGSGRGAGPFVVTGRFRPGLPQPVDCFLVRKHAPGLAADCGAARPVQVGAPQAALLLPVVAFALSVLGVAVRASRRRADRRAAPCRRPSRLGGSGGALLEARVGSGVRALRSSRYPTSYHGPSAALNSPCGAIV